MAVMFKVVSISLQLGRAVLVQIIQKLPLLVPVEFLYIKPTDATDNRRWLTGFVRGSRELMEKANIHNHPTHPSSKIPYKIQNDIRDAVTENHHLKTSHLVEGNT